MELGIIFSLYIISNNALARSNMGIENGQDWGSHLPLSMVDKLQPPRSRSFDFGQTRDFGDDDETDAFFVESHDCLFFIFGWGDGWVGRCHGWATFFHHFQVEFVQEVVTHGAGLIMAYGN